MDISQIKKEIRSLIEERDTFSAEVELDVYGLPEMVSISPREKVMIEYSLDLEMRRWGIKGASIQVLTESIKVPATDDSGEDPVDLDLDLDLGETDSEMQCDGEVRFLQVVPVKLEIDLKNKKSKLILQVS